MGVAQSLHPAGRAVPPAGPYQSLAGDETGPTWTIGQALVLVLVLTLVLLAGVGVAVVTSADHRDAAVAASRRLSHADEQVTDLLGLVVQERTAQETSALSSDRSALIGAVRGREGEDLRALPDLVSPDPHSMHLLASLGRDLFSWRGTPGDDAHHGLRAVAFARVSEDLIQLLAETSSRAFTAREAVDATARRVQDTVYASFVGSALLVSCIFACMGFWLSRPVARLNRDVGRLRDGDLFTIISASGSAELHRLGQHIDAMRKKLVGQIDGAAGAEAERARALLQASHDALSESNRELEAFAVTISHDLKSPLRTISGFTSIVLAEHAAQLDREAVRLLGRVVASATRLDTLTDDLLTFARLRHAVVTREQVSLRAAVSQVWRDLRSPETVDRVDLWLGPLPDVRADPSLLRQVLTNLLGNAIKFSLLASDRARDGLGPDVRRVRVDSRPAPDGQLVIRVRDHGVGFDPRAADTMFQPFARFHSDDVEGTGIGLSIVDRIVRRHGGTVWADSAPGQGATFSFTLGPDAQLVPERGSAATPGRG